MIIATLLRFQKFRPHENEKLTFSNLFGLNSVFEKLCFRDRFRERLQNTPASHLPVSVCYEERGI